MTGGQALADTAEGNLWLLCRLDNRLCALPLEPVVEIMRPLPVEPLAGAPPFVRGLSIIRGAPVPVVDVALLLGASRNRSTRYVTIRAGARHVALEVDEVLGVRVLPLEKLQAVPPLFREAPADIVSAIGAADDKLLLVLRSARLVPDSLWTVFEAEGVSP